MRGTLQTARCMRRTDARIVPKSHFEARAPWNANAIGRGASCRWLVAPNLLASQAARGDRAANCTKIDIFASRFRVTASEMGDQQRPSTMRRKQPPPAAREWPMPTPPLGVNARKARRRTTDELSSPRRRRLVAQVTSRRLAPRMGWVNRGNSATKKMTGYSCKGPAFRILREGFILPRPRRCVAQPAAANARATSTERPGQGQGSAPTARTADRTTAKRRLGGRPTAAPARRRRRSSVRRIRAMRSRARRRPAARARCSGSPRARRNTTGSVGRGFHHDGSPPARLADLTTKLRR